MNTELARMAVITLLAEKSPQLGRTALMKFCYFLQTLRRVPLGYDFTLYSYGPFDSDVLADLDATEAMGGVISKIVYYSGGYGYAIAPGPQAQDAKRRSAEFLRRYEQDIDWVLAEFGAMASAQLELAGTIIYSDRESARKSEHLAIDQLAQRVHDVKPRFSKAQIMTCIRSLASRGLLKSVPAAYQAREL